MPEGAIYVGRPTVWQNPFKVSRDLHRAAAIELFRELARGFIHPAMHDHADVSEWMKRMRAYGHPSEAARGWLRARDLCCWCAPSLPCHADVWLELANA